MSPPIVLTTTAAVAGGAAMAREDSGRVVFVSGALPGERVEVELTDERKDFAKAAMSRVLDASSDRVAPPCPHVAEGCGGCDLQHARLPAQREMKRAIVADALRRLGRLPETVVGAGPALTATGFRTTVRCGVTDGRAGFRRARSHDVVVVDACLVAHPRIDAFMRRGSYLGADEVTFRVGGATGEALVVAGPTAAAIDLPDELSGESVIVVGDDELLAGRRAWYHDVVDGHRFRISARSFFQSRADGASALVGAVREAGGDELAGAAHLVDAYGGVGLFGALLTPPGARLTLVETNRSALADARQNLAHVDAKIVRADVATWRPSTCAVVIADPSRSGLGAQAAGALAATRAEVIVLVSCDAAALGRDSRLLGERGYRFEQASLVDLFPHTHHVEVVSRFVRVGPAS